MAPSSDRWRVSPGTELHLGGVDPGSTAGAPGDEDATDAASEELRSRLEDLQERLWAEDRRSLLLVLQAIDAGGKDGTIKKVFSGVNPQGVKVTSFKEPSDEELAHDFLWRVHKAVPARGEIGIFNRSHYEDVLVVRVHDIVPKSVWSKRYGIINDFEHTLTEAGTTVVKLFLHISKDEQAERFRKRLDNPHKRWKFSKGDLAERARWDDYVAAFEDAISKTSTEHAPWYVIPADHKWYRDWAALSILVDTLEGLDPKFPEPEEGLDSVVVE
ncbi:MAG TPA: polyphosphate kinase 2 family protein [Acidimicrobiales bacterium]|nr:polyphosphate kinase 2 family protein [Acidimicrobiales bacterium]